MDVLTRQTLLGRLGSGNDPAAWEEFCRLYQPLVRTYIARFRVQENDADDLVQDVFVKLHARLAQFDLDHARGQFRAFLRSVTDNTVRDFLRSAQRRRQAVAGVDPQDLASQFEQSDAGEATRDAQWRKAVFDIVLQRVRQEFADRSKTLACFEQTTLGGRAAKDVAAELEIDSVNTVYVYAHRVLQRIRELCAEYDEEVADRPSSSQ